MCACPMRGNTSDGSNSTFAATAHALSQTSSRGWCISFLLSILHHTTLQTHKCTPNKNRSEFTSNEAIDAEVQRLKTEMFTMRIKFAKREAYQPAQYKALRKRIAQLLTVRRERQIEQGIDRRTSRALEKRRMVEAGLGQF